MPDLTLKKLSNQMGAVFKGEDTAFKGISCDTRHLKPGDVYVAIKGTHSDGHKFIEKALSLGAAGFLVSEEIKTDKPFILVPDTKLGLGQLAKAYRTHFNTPIIAITGSSGKTTVKEMVYNILKIPYKVHVNPGNFNNEIGLPLSLLALNEDHDCAILEMGARKVGDIQYLMDIANPSISLVTNVGQAHIEIFGSSEKIAQAKGEIYQYLNPNGIAILNADEKYIPYWRQHLKTQKILSFGLTNNADLSIGDYSLEPEKTAFQLKSDIGNISITLNYPGLHNVKNALAAAAIARAMGIELTVIKQGLENVTSIPGRLEFKRGLNQSIVIDDSYNANPGSMIAGLKVLSNLSGTKIFIMGDMFELGQDAEKMHYEVGVEAKKLGINYLLGVGDFTHQAVKGFGENATHYMNKTALVQEAEKFLQADTKVLVKGSRGMHMEEVVSAICESHI